MNKSRIEGVADQKLKQWKRGTTMYRELLAMGAKPDVARQVAANSRRRWRNSGMLLNAVLTLNWSDRPGLPRLS
jgi:RNA-directed DNA polymerase